MAVEVRQFTITIPSGTPSSAPQVTQMSMPTRQVDRVEVDVPPGPRGEVGFRIGSSGTQLIPFQLGQWIITDRFTDGWDLTGQHDSGSWEFTAYNTGLFAHTIQVRFLVRLSAPGSSPDNPQPIAPQDLGSAAASVGVPPPIDIPPPPTIPALPPLPTIPALPPPPTIPALPPPPTLPGTQGPHAPAPAPHLNYWSDAMGELLTWPDQTNTTRFDEVLLLPDGSVGWYAFPGGAGQWASYNGPPTNLGGHFVKVSSCLTQFAGVIRLNIVGTAADGTRSLKVMNAVNFSQIADWTQQPAAQPTELPLSRAAAVAA